MARYMLDTDRNTKWEDVALYKDAFNLLYGTPQVWLFGEILTTDGDYIFASRGVMAVSFNTKVNPLFIVKIDGEMVGIPNTPDHGITAVEFRS